MKDLCLAIEIGGTKLQIFEGTSNGKILKRSRFAVDRQKGAAHIQQTIRQYINSSPVSYKKIGVGFGGPIDSINGKVACSHQIHGWSGFNFKKWLKKFSKAEVHVDNDANVAGFAEALRGAGKGYQSVFYVTLGSGVGGGCITNGTIYHGAVPGESEIGHLILKPDGTVLEKLCSGWAVDQLIRQKIKNFPRSKLARLIGNQKGGEARYLKPALSARDRVAISILQEVAENLALGLSHVCHLFHPEVIILGGGLSLLGSPLTGAVSEALRPKLMKVFKPPAIKIAKLREDVVPIGALLLCGTQNSDVR